MKQQKQQHQSLLSPDMFTWVLQKQFDWLGGYEYSIEIVGIDGCIGYGDTIIDAKRDLYKAFTRLLKSNKIKEVPVEDFQLIIMLPVMKIDDFNYVNQSLLALS